MRLAPRHLAMSLTVVAALAIPASGGAQNATVPFPITRPPLQLPVPEAKCSLDEADPGARVSLQKVRRQLTRSGMDAGRLTLFFDCSRIAEARRTNRFDIEASGLAVVHIQNFNFRRTGLKSREFAAEQCNNLKEASGELPIAGTAEWKAEMLRQAAAKGDGYLPVVHQAGRVCYSALVEKGTISFVAFSVVRGMGLMIVTTNYEQQEPQGLVAHFELLRGYLGMLHRANPLLRAPTGQSTPTDPDAPQTGLTPSPGETERPRRR